MLFAVQTPAPPPQVPPEVFMPPPPWVTMPPEAIVMISLAFFAAAALVLFPLMRALARRIEGKARGVDVERLTDELDALRAQMGELEQVHGRVAELEERVDFAERLLARERSADRLPRTSSLEEGR